MLLADIGALPRPGNRGRIEATQLGELQVQLPVVCHGYPRSSSIGMWATFFPQAALQESHKPSDASASCSIPHAPPSQRALAVECHIPCARVLM
eukprot:2719516-Amphidinium_carterae.1